jgi:iron complex outermembrane receptor protein
MTAIVHDMHLAFSNNQFITLRYWYQESDRNIPYAMISKPGKAQEKQSAFRAMTEWKQLYRHGSLSMLTSFTKDDMRYDDAQFTIASLNRFASAYSKIEYNHSLMSRLSVISSFNHQYNEAFTTEYGDRKRQHLVSGSMLLSYMQENLRASIGLRKEFNTMGPLPYIPYGGLQWDIGKHWSIRTSISRNYRLPTMNELYWIPGGNPNLVAESGWNGDAGIMLKNIKIAQNVFLEADLSAYKNTIRNSIAWLPLNGSIWSPVNLKTLDCTGIENSLRIHGSKGKLQIQGSIHYTLSYATHKKTHDGTEGMQMFYVPFENASATLNIGYRNTSFTFNPSYTGFRYTVSDQSKTLPSFTIARALISQNMVYGNIQLTASAEINNIFNESYQIIQYRPMPGRSFLFHLTMHLNKN